MGNSAFGKSALERVEGDQNCGFGSGAGNDLINGSGNCFFGYVSAEGGDNLTDCSLFGKGTTVSSGLTNATAIGANASVTVSNAIVLGDSTVPTKVGIGTNSPETILHTVGSVQFQGISAGFTGSGYVKGQEGLSTTGAGTDTLDFPVPTSIPTQIFVRIDIAVMDTTGARTGYATSVAAAFWNGVSTASTGTLPAIVFTTTAAFLPLAAWSISGDNLRLTVTGVAATDEVWVVSYEIFSTTNTVA